MEYQQSYSNKHLLWEQEINYDEQEIKYVNLLDDLGFKHVFGRDENKEILIAFLNEIIPDKQIIDLEHIRNEQVPFDPDTKASVFDLYCETQDGSRIVVELQREEQFDYIDRAIYYGAFPIQNQIAKGKKRYTFSAVYVINILNFNLVELRGDNNPVSTFRLKELKTNKILSHKYTLIFIELSKFAKRLEEISPDNILEGYLYFLRNMHNFKEQPKEFQQQIWDKLFNAARVAKMNRQERQAYIKKMNTERDRINQWEFAMEQAKTKGMAEEKMTIAKSMKLEGISVDIICKCTGLSIEEIENL
ncbi:MAG: Rpn family recombination-promoting nuclease/putative transposase [Bacteroidales bacterium]|nr:Rpn family recombination-promoting nuclease/putative transposase [Bacteroidales bacterium]